MIYLLWLVCFYDCTILLLVPSSATLILAADGTTARMIVDLCAIAIGLYALFTTGFKPLTNKWVLFFILFMVFSHFHGLNMSVSGPFCPPDMAVYDYKPMFEILMFLCMFMGIKSMLITPEYLDKLYRSFALIGIIYSAYILLQRIGCDQVYKLIDMAICHLSRNPEAGGFISQPVFAAAMLVMCMPFVQKYFKWWNLLVLLAVWLTGNRSALVAIGFLSLYSFTGIRKHIWTMIFIYMGILAVLTAIYAVDLKAVHWFQSSGRLENWKNIILDFLHPAFPGVHQTYILTGMGIGSFGILYPFYHGSPFVQAHNEFLEVLYTLSFGGLFLFIKSFQHVFSTIKNDQIFMSVVGILICALTNAVWHIPQLQFLTVFLIGIAYNQEVSRGT
jgi:hypothetical protein